MANGEPKTVKELCFYIRGELSVMRAEAKGEFNTLKESLNNIKRTTFWFGGIAGAIISGVIVGLLKLLGGI